MNKFMTCLILLTFFTLNSKTSFALDCERTWPSDVADIAGSRNSVNKQSDLIISPNTELSGTGAKQNTTWKIDKGITITHTQGRHPDKMGSACVSVPRNFEAVQLYCGVAEEGQKSLEPCYPIADKKECPLGYIRNTKVRATPPGAPNPQQVCVEFANSSGDKPRHIGIIVRIKPR
ncbi:hypothetical protein AB4Y32_09900 [Paraburkholderia phymatum]|uniref:Uncharacterized protein n=1 Tax=Paraburkholderia phymatum TaxID=148447 RepID=A0ACC6TXZ5_9BURK